MYTIYIIEDNEDFSAYLSDLIKTTGWAKAKVFNNGLKGLEACIESPPHCLILDLGLPNLPGEEICRILRSSPKHRNMPIIICSELTNARKLEMEMLTLGANSYFKKPVDSNLLLNSILTNISLLEIDNLIVDADPDTKMEPEILARAPAESYKIPESNKFHGYEIIEMVGGGGMGTVFKARQINLDRLVAIKVLSAQYTSDNKLAKRFEREAKILAQLNHPNLVHIYDIGQGEISPFFVMEFVDGDTLIQFLNSGTMSIPKTTDIIRQICDALIYLHSMNVIHRDIKPSNIMITETGIVKLTDFGICRTRLRDELTDFTQVRISLGTPYYMAPEVARGEKATEASDQYSLGVTIWCLLTRKHPRSAYLPVTQFRKDLSYEINTVLARCMESDSEKRFPDIKHARAAILKCLDISGSKKDIGTMIIDNQRKPDKQKNPRL